MEKIHTREEVIKALELCTIDGIEMYNCDQCPYVNEQDNVKSMCRCIDSLMFDALHYLREPASKCKWPDGIDVRLDGIHSTSPHKFKEMGIFKNVTVQILECPTCGETSIGWYRQDNTEEVTNEASN